MERWTTAHERDGNPRADVRGMFNQVALPKSATALRRRGLALVALSWTALVATVAASWELNGLFARVLSPVEFAASTLVHKFLASL
jgi:hypothetical protein